MRHRQIGSRSAGLLAVSAIAAGLAVGQAAGALAATPNAQQPTQDETTHAVTLVTGDNVVVREVAGHQVVSVAPRPGSTGGFITQRTGGDLYVIPVTALPYLDRSLDRSLFDVSALIRDGLTQTPVQASSAGAPPAGPRFGAALAQQAAADAPRHFVGDGTLFGQVASVKLAAPGAPAPATPNFPMRTVKITAVDQSGQPTSASLGVLNTDDGREYGAFPEAVNGEARISVPTGNYGLVAYFPVFDAKFQLAELRMVTTDFVVTGDTALTTVGIDARRATSKVSVSTPRASTQTGLTLGYQRTDARRFSSLGSSFSGGNAAVYVAPSAPSTVGSLHFSVQTHSDGPAGTADPYSYDIKLDNDGAVAANQHYRVTSDELSTLKEAYYSDEPARQESTSRIMMLPYETFGFGSFTAPFSAPTRRTEYVGGSAGLAISDALIANWASFGGFTTDSLRRYSPQSTIPVDWLRGPLLPGEPEPVPGTDPSGFWGCSACRKDDQLSVVLTPVIDTSGHRMYLDAATTGVVSTSHFQLLSGGKSLLDGRNITGGTVTLPPQQATYEIVYDQTRTAPWFHQSTVSHSEWTFDSAHSGTQTVPAAWSCRPDGKPADCSALPLVTAHYQLGAGLDGTGPAGPDQVVVTFGHVPGAANLPVAKAAVAVSFDGGTTWTPTFFADLGNGRYRAQWTNPASTKGGDVALRASATDVAGSTLTQTVTAALTIPGAATEGSR